MGETGERGDAGDILQTRSEREEEGEARADLSALLASAPDFILYLDRDGHIRFLNRSQRFASPSELIGRSLLEGIAPEHQEQARQAVERVLATGERQSIELLARAPDGSRPWFALTMGPVVREGRITGVVCVSRDITRKRQLEAELMARDRLAAMGMLAAGVAHEINNPLTALLAAVSELAETSEGNALALVHDAREAAEHIRAVVTDVQSLSRERAQAEPVDVVEAVGTAVRLARYQLRDRARLELSLEPVPPVLGSRSRLCQVVLNLLANAAQAIAPGRATDNVIRVATSLQAPHVVLAVEDSGRGMSEAQREGMFTPFATTKTEGTGLGLALSRQIVEAMGGSLEVQSELGRGSALTVRLPTTASSTQSPVVAGVIAAGLHVGVLDDDPSIGRALGKLLHEHDVEAFTEADALYGRLSRGPAFDVVICDVLLPETSGLAVYERLRRDAPALAGRIVFMTGGGLSAEQLAGVERSGRPLLGKPFRRRELLAALAHVLTQLTQ